MPLNIRLTWNKNTDDTTEYGVWRRQENTELSEVTRVAQPGDGSNPVYEDTNVDIADPSDPTIATNKPTATTSTLEITTPSEDAANPVYYYSIKAYDEAGNASPLCPEVSLQPSNAIDRYEWELVRESDTTVVDSGQIDPLNPISTESTLTEGNSYHYKAQAFDLDENTSNIVTSATFTA
jgi:hypothetical protein